MPRRIIFAALSLALLAGLSPEARAQTRRDDPQVLTNAAVVKLSRAGFSDKALISIIVSRPTRFDLAPERLIELKKGGVSERVILAMLGREDNSYAFDADDDDFTNDPFFRDTKPRAGDAAPKSGAPADPGETNIFGSSGGTRGRTRQRAGNGSLEDDTETIGSASVRILRPPAEAGGAGHQPKLERTPTLTNDSVILLVDGGFSDGTIIRRIEQSPAEFDLSEAKLTELRRRRVSEPVIAAMRAAMSDEPVSASPPRQRR